MPRTDEDVRDTSAVTTAADLREDGSPAGRDLALAIWALMVGFALLMCAGGLFATLLGVRSEQRGLTTLLTGSISAAYYVGFLLGSRVTLESLARVGHIRVYAALASLLSASYVLVGLTESPYGWMALRLCTGLCTAGLYVVAESWLNDLATNANRGRLLAVYTLVSSGAWGAGMLLLNRMDASAFIGYALAGVLTSVAVTPVALSEASAPPALAPTEHVSLKELAEIVPTGVFSCLLIGVAHGALGGMAAVFATRVGLSIAETSLFVAAPLLGGLLLQWPISQASDDVDRRAVGVVTSLGAAGASALLLLGPADAPMALVLMVLVGGTSYPLYAISASYTNDWVEPRQVTAAASQLITLYGIGAIVGPFAASGLMIVIGPEGFFWSLAILHAMLAVFFGYRMKAWRSPLVKRPWDEVSLPARAFFVPATVVAFSRRVRKAR
jgi:MFS family permease